MAFTRTSRLLQLERNPVNYNSILLSLMFAHGFTNASMLISMWLAFHAVEEQCGNDIGSTAPFVDVIAAQMSQNPVALRPGSLLL